MKIIKNMKNMKINEIWHVSKKKWNEEFRLSLPFNLVNQYQ